MNKKLIPCRLEQAGFPVEAADDGFQAVQAMTPWDYHAMLMDRQLPETDGLRAMEADGEWYLASGMDALPSKPTNRPELAAMLDRRVPPRIEAALSS